MTDTITEIAARVRHHLVLSVHTAQRSGELRPVAMSSQYRSTLPCDGTARDASGHLERPVTNPLDIVGRQSAAEPTDANERRLVQSFHLWDLVPLSVSSVGPMFSVAATGGVMAAQAGWWTLPAIAILAVPFIISSFVFRLLNRHFPHAGASYHWSARVIGRGVSRYQAWILILAYFFSIPPIAIPASAYTLALVAPGYHAPAIVRVGVTLFWIGFAAVPLLRGGRPTARITQVFFAVEMVSLAGFAVFGALSWRRLSVPIHFGSPPIGGILVVSVVAATILDGWEIDSYAAEESRRPRDHPGVGGIVGAIGALLFYAILYPLMLGETPLHLLANSTDPLAVWSHRLVPGAPWIMLVPILLSTAGGLWLTSFILTRALYAMGRERLIPSGFARLNGRHVPHVAIVASLGLAAAVVALQLLVSSLGSFFTLVLSAAGFFLLAEFFLDSVTAAVFLTIGHKRLPDVRLQPHGHRLLLLGSLFSSMVMAALLATFFVYGPKAVGGGVDETFGVLLALGLVFAWWTRRRALTPVVFAGNDVPAGGAETS
ncbi:MAG TPA: APC family permease [Acidimicrobiales bacterium]|nr:APC family permease [Acidimicrobiales bacterium]